MMIGVWIAGGGLSDIAIPGLVGAVGKSARGGRVVLLLVVVVVPEPAQFGVDLVCGDFARYEAVG